MYPVRVSAKALVYKDDKILCSHYRANDEEYFIFPGGGLNGEETAEEAVVREVLEETGYGVEVRELAFVREFIYGVEVRELAFVREFIPGRLGYAREFDKGFHQIELFFICTLVDENPVPPSEHDKNQVGCVWLPLAELTEKEVYPTCMQRAVQARQFPKRYIGNQL